MSQPEIFLRLQAMQIYLPVIIFRKSFINTLLKLNVINHFLLIVVFFSNNAENRSQTDCCIAFIWSSLCPQRHRELKALVSEILVWKPERFFPFAVSKTSALNTGHVILRREFAGEMLTWCNHGLLQDICLGLPSQSHFKISHKMWCADAG